MRSRRFLISRRGVRKFCRHGDLRLLWRKQRTITPMSRAIPKLNQRSSEILRQIIDAYLETGEPVGSSGIRI